jgi:hypothetical protein
MNTFTVVNDDTLSHAIRNCRNRLVYVAPGISLAIAQALGERVTNRDKLAVTVIIDLDPEVYRLGYGTPEGLKALQQIMADNGFELRNQAGLRVGLLIVDEEVIVYAPTPQLIEAGSEEPSKPNAISIGREPLAQITHACAANAPSGEESTALPMQAEIGREAAKPAQVEATLQNLVEVPPKRFDVARVERVFNTKIQYVELEVTGYRLSTKKVAIPNYLLVGDDQELGRRIKNTFTLLEGSDVLKVSIPDSDSTCLEPELDANNNPIMVNYDETQLEFERKKIYDDFLICVNGYGWVIMRSRRDAFDTRIDWFKSRVKAYSLEIRKKLNQAMSQSVKELAKTLLPRVREKIPERYLKYVSTTTVRDDDLLAMIEQDLSDAFGTSEQFFSPEVSVIFKDVTYESIRDEKFRSALSETMRKRGGERIVAQLFEEHDAAPEALL